MNEARLLEGIVPVIDFYPEPLPDIPVTELCVLKTTTRTMRTIRHGTFIARQIYLYHPDHKYIDGEKKKIKKYTSQQFQVMVRGKSCFTMDVVCDVGMLRFLKNKSREETQEEIYRKHGLVLSTGTISNLALEFLIRFEKYHTQQFNRLVDAMKKDGGYILGADGTGDGGSDRILLLMDLLKGWALVCDVIPSEKETYITPLLDDLVERAGRPLAFLRDMGQGLCKAGKTLPHGVPTKECDYHFTRDVGRDMMTNHYQEFRRVMIRLKVRSDLVRLRKRLNHDAKSRSIDPRRIMQSLRRNEPVEDIEAAVLTETYHTISWILNYHEDAHGRRFPHSLPWLYLYERCHQGRDAVYEILSTAETVNSSVEYLNEFQRIIEKISRDKTADVLTNLKYRIKKGFDIFSELREILKISENKSDIPRDQLLISGEEALDMEDELKKFRDRLSAAVEKGACTPEEKIMLDHLIRHWDGLIYPNLTVIVNGEEKKVAVPRAISLVDARFSQVKAGIRKRTGKKDTGYELNRYGKVLCLIQNLHSEEYVNVMFGSIEHLSNTLGDLPKEEVDKAITKFREAQCRYDITNAKGKGEFNKLLSICKKVRKDIESSMIKKLPHLLPGVIKVPIPTDS